MFLCLAPINKAKSCVIRINMISYCLSYPFMYPIFRRFSCIKYYILVINKIIVIIRGVIGCSIK